MSGVSKDPLQQELHLQDQILAHEQDEIQAQNTTVEVPQQRALPGREVEKIPQNLTSVNLGEAIAQIGIESSSAPPPPPLAKSHEVTDGITNKTKNETSKVAESILGTAEEIDDTKSGREPPIYLDELVAEEGDVQLKNIVAKTDLHHSKEDLREIMWDRAVSSMDHHLQQNDKVLSEIRETIALFLDFVYVDSHEALPSETVASLARATQKECQARGTNDLSAIRAEINKHGFMFDPESKTMFCAVINEDSIKKAYEYCLERGIDSSQVKLFAMPKKEFFAFVEIISIEMTKISGEQEIDKGEEKSDEKSIEKFEQKFEVKLDKQEEKKEVKENKTESAEKIPLVIPHNIEEGVTSVHAAEERKDVEEKKIDIEVKEEKREIEKEGIKSADNTTKPN